MVNHISAKSSYFQDYLDHGQGSEYADLFITVDKIWPDGEIPPDDFQKIFLRRPEPYSDYQIKTSGETARVWTTFGKTTPSEQIDLDVNAAKTRQLFKDFLTNFAENKIKIVRLDAVGYITKKPGTSFFFVEPEIYEFLDWMTELAQALGLVLLPEVHAHYKLQYKLAQRGQWIYDFILPYRVLEALLEKDSQQLTAYLHNRPANQFTMLDCHDGVPIKPDLNDLYDSDTARRVVDICLERGSNLSLIYAPEHQDPDGFDVHQIRGTYYSLLGEDDNAYLAARAIQFFTPGVPQVYYVGMLAGKNDLSILEKGGEGRDINRSNYTLDEIKTALNKPVVQRLMKLIEFRNQFPAFDGDFQVKETTPDQISLSWEKQTSSCTLLVDLKDMKSSIHYRDDDGKQQIYEV
jgi:sucrose phosphorylase